MEATLKTQGKKSLNYYMRVLHRDLGFFAVGLIIVYSLSGILLVYRDTNLMKADKQIEKKLEPSMEPGKIGEALRIRDFKVTSAQGEIITFPGGTYNATTGMAIYTTKEIIAPFNKFINLHKAVSKNPSHWFNVLFGVVLLFMAISSFWMFKPQNKNFRRGLYLAGAGIVFVLILLML